MDLLKVLTPFTGKETAPLYPKSVILETTNLCNLRCTMCHIWSATVKRKRPAGFVSEEIWRSAIDEISKWNEQISVALHGAGEALLHDDFIKILSFASSKKNLSVGFLSNGTLLSKETSRAILDTDIAWIGFSVDGIDKEKYKEYRGADLAKVESAIEYLLTLRRGSKPFVFVNMVELPDLNPEEFIDRWIEKVDEVRISRYRPIGHRDFLTEKMERIPCNFLNEMLVIAWNGDVVMCCEDIWADVRIGHFPDKSLYELWHSSQFNKIRKLHRKGKYSAIPLCADCDAWSNATISIETNETDNLRLIKCPAQTSYQRISKSR